MSSQRRHCRRRNWRWWPDGWPGITTSRPNRLPNIISNQWRRFSPRLSNEGWFRRVTGESELLARYEITVSMITRRRLLLPALIVIATGMFATTHSQERPGGVPYGPVPSNTVHNLFRIGDRVYCGSGPESYDFNLVGGVPHQADGISVRLADSTLKRTCGVSITSPVSGTRPAWVTR